MVAWPGAPCQEALRLHAHYSCSVDGPGADNNIVVRLPIVTKHTGSCEVLRSNAGSIRCSSSRQAIWTARLGRGYCIHCIGRTHATATALLPTFVSHSRVGLDTMSYAS
ncbi:hypothetical protein DOTSEDRAFT_70840 [Dothistroma septosporum NZE10]|uniref:Uncharacterized protein n=1 Tax=Dothistroma septosporum (strain NZE10 / CBS 128990) TaxID=675120 RepID=N1PR77_DOTSN|nr:hypothetical protein DOTSEDRAFT_70840 [Dothistroma septosporum NZE10]